MDAASAEPMLPAGSGPLVTMRAALEEMGAARRELQQEPGLDAVAARLEVATEELRVVEEELGRGLAADLADQGDAFTRRLVSTLPVAVVTTTPDGAVVEANTAAEELLRQPAAVLEHKPVFTFVDVDQRSAVRSLLKSAVTDGSTRDGQVRLRFRDGGTVDCRARVIAGSTAGGVRWVLQPAAAASTDGKSLAALVELCGLSIADSDLRGTLSRITRLAADGVTAAASASVVLGDPGAPEILASSTEGAQSADGLQLETGTGPAFEAYASLRPCYCDDLLSDPRWPALGLRVHGRPDQQGRRGPACLAVPLLVGAEQALGVLTLYGSIAPGPEADLSSVESLRQARPFVVAVESLVRDSRIVAEIVKVRDQLREALTSRAVIDQAKGMVMVTRRCDPDEAFAYLSQLSNDTNRKVRDVASAIVAGTSGPALKRRA